MSFGTIVEDMKVSFKLVRKSFLSYFLAMVGLSILVGVILAIVVLPIIAISEWAQNTQIVSQFKEFVDWVADNPWRMGGIVSLIAMPMIGLCFVYIGSLYGLSKELVQDGNTRAENAFHWFRKRFISFAAAGILIVLVVFGPIIVVSLTFTYVFGSISGIWAAILIAVAFLWIYGTLGLLSMVLPSVVDGKGVVEAFRESIELSISRFDRVFGIWTVYSLLSVSMFAPILILGFFEVFHLMRIPLFVSLAGKLIIAWTLIASLLMVFVVIPGEMLAFTRVYAVLTGKKIAKQRPAIIPMSVK